MKQQTAIWTPFLNGFVKGRIGVFPVVPDAWGVFENFTGEWRPVEPYTAAIKHGYKYTGRQENPTDPWQRSEAETIYEAKKLAEAWLSGQNIYPL